MKPWWERYPGRREFELQELEAAGILCELDKSALAEGAVVLHLIADVKGYPGLKLRVTYPDLYPTMPFEIEAPDLSLPHHQNPFDKNLCLLDNPGENWRPAEDTVARFIQDRLSDVLGAGCSDQKSDLEARRSEPVSNYFKFSANSIIFFDSAWSVASGVRSGKLIIGINELPNEAVFRGAVLEVRDRDSSLLASSAGEIAEAFKKKLKGRWVRFDRAPASRELKDIFAEAVSMDNRLIRLLDNPQKNSCNVDVIGVLFPEETRWRETGDSWMFIVRTVRNGKTYPLLVRGGRAGRSDLQGRNPSLAGLWSKKIAAFGLGCIGAASVLEFARCGVGELRLLDDDHVEPGTTVRWPFGLQTAAGKDKGWLLGSIIAADYPFTNIVASACRLGKAYWRPNGEGGLSERELLARMLDGVDLVYDATAEPMINRALSELSAERGIPYILVSGTPGMWGGRLVRIRPSENHGCWSCYRHATMGEEIPVPRADEVNGLVAPEGCSAPTFTGTNFDASEISMGGVRLAISTLMEGIEGGYPPIDWDVAVINLRDEVGGVIPPQWSTHKLIKHPDCHCRSAQ